MAVVVVVLRKSKSTMKSTVSGLIAANSRQLELNINSYLGNVESTAALLFADDDYYLYDATDSSVDEYTKVKSEEKILNRIVDMGLMDNYADFCIVYADDSTVGWYSLTTSGMFPDGGIYDEFASYIANDSKEECWAFGLHDNYDRMYYAKRMNPNAILLLSFYNRELTSVFEYPEELDGMTIRLIDDDNLILYSSDKNEIGQNVPTDEAQLIGTATSQTSVNDAYFVNTNVCENGWRVVCSIPTEVVLSENRSLEVYAVGFAIVIAALFMLIGTYIIRKLSGSMDGLVSNLEEKAVVDQLSGLFNKISYQEAVTSRLANVGSNTVIVLIMLDVDNFKQVNDNLGHEHGDSVISRMGLLLTKYWGEDILVGRVGGDEFSVFVEYKNYNQQVVENTIERRAEELASEFRNEFEYEYEKCKVSLSIGAYIDKTSKIKFEDIYPKADKALYYSKRNGKNRYTLYSEKLDETEEAGTNEKKR
jgi:diguanylate cyclase (GGDEF)-like protein